MRLVYRKLIDYHERVRETSTVLYKLDLQSNELLSLFLLEPQIYFVLNFCVIQCLPKSHFNIQPIAASLSSSFYFSHRGLNKHRHLWFVSAMALDHSVYICLSSVTCQSFATSMETNFRFVSTNTPECVTHI